jgi:regulatory protein
MRISSLSSYRRKFNKNLVCVIEWDTGEKLEVEPDTVIQLNLHEGDDLDEEGFHQLLLTDEQKKCVAAALNLISIRMRSRNELRERFLRDGYSENAIENALTRLEENGYLNDEAFAKKFIRSLLQKKNIGKSAVQFELRKKGIPSKIIDRAVQELYDNRNELEDAMAAAKKKMVTYREKDPVKRRMKLSLFLRQRGFSSETVQSVIAKLSK